MKPGRPHRLPLEYYIGRKTVAFEAVTFDRMPIFTSEEVVNVHVEFLREAADEFGCSVLIYCFMPDHLHGMLVGLHEDSDCRRAIGKYKLRSGKWFYRKKLPDWQGNFYDHIVRGSEEWHQRAYYIARNPVEAGLVAEILDYPFTGSIGYNLAEIIQRSE